ncbi:MAG: UBA/THIF-type binding protein [Verrucomicrobia bacterium]|jgi:tRNA A37 threonylcarbamoyladenosine dehydratase|nr:UBA/THIF-type binding protein [Verrucomicrobiota bacterium]
MNDYEARFGGIARLYGRETLCRLRQSHACVVGVGGVGSWAVEALARSGVGELTLIDLDEVCISNTNRQLPALTGKIGQPKVEVLKDRVLTINPECRINAVQQFFTATSAAELLAIPCSGVLDAIDSLKHKALLIAECHKRNIPIVVSGGAGGRRDPTAIRYADLSDASHDRLLQQTRKLLRKEYGFPASGQPFGIDCVFTSEPPLFPQGDGTVCDVREKGSDMKMNCESGYGAATFVTGAFGFAAAARLVERVIARKV